MSSHAPAARVAALSAHLLRLSATNSQESVNSGESREKEGALEKVPEVNVNISKNPIAGLLQVTRGRDIVLMKTPGFDYIVPIDPKMFDEVLGSTDTFVPSYFFADPNKKHSTVLTELFNLPEAVAIKYEDAAMNGLKRAVQARTDFLSTCVIKGVDEFLASTNWTTAGQEAVSLHDLGDVVFWGMTTGLAGVKPGPSTAQLRGCFDLIDKNKRKGIMRVPIPGLREAVDGANAVFKAQSFGGNQPLAPLPDVYLNATQGDIDAAANILTGAWWGALGNSIPTLQWMLVYILTNPVVKARAYAEADSLDEFGAPYLTRCMKETLRLATYSAAWRMAAKDTALTSSQGVSYFIPKGSICAPQFSSQHFDAKLFGPDPFKFDPEHFAKHMTEIAPEVDGHPYAWLPFSAGVHKCGGARLAVQVEPLICKRILRKYLLSWPASQPFPEADAGNAMPVFAFKGGDEAVRVEMRQRA